MCSSKIDVAGLLVDHEGYIHLTAIALLFMKESPNRVKVNYTT